MSPTKTCTGCSKELPLNEFNKDKSTKDGLTRRCKHCRSVMFAAWREVNKEKAVQASRDWRAENPDKARAAVLRWKAANPDKARDMIESWRLANPEAMKDHARRAARRYRERLGASNYNAKLVAYRLKSPTRYKARSSRIRALRLKRHPSWADQSKIEAVYAEAERITRQTGVLHHVDHEIPLLGRLVSGLHVHQNLRPLPAVDNLRKSNKFEVSNG